MSFLIYLVVVVVVFVVVVVVNLFVFAEVQIVFVALLLVIEVIERPQSHRKAQNSFYHFTTISMVLIAEA